MYERAIKELQRLLDHAEGLELSDAQDHALSSAVTILEAAEPRSEAAEREYCARVAALVWNGPCSLEAAVVHIERERYGARAEGYAAGHAIARDSILELGRLRSALIAACNALSACDGKGCTADAVVAELQAVLKGAPGKRRVRMGQALDEFVSDVAEALKKGQGK